MVVKNNNMVSLKTQAPAKLYKLMATLFLIKILAYTLVEQYNLD